MSGHDTYQESSRRLPGVRPRLGLFLNVPMHEVDSGLTARYAHLFDFFLALGERAAHAWLCVPLRRGGERQPEYGRVDLPENVQVVGLPHWSSAPMLVRRIHVVLPVAVWRLARHLRQWDVVGAVVPSVVGNLFVAVARLFRRPVFMLVRGEKQRTVSWIMGRRLRTLPFLWALRLMELPVRRWIRKGVPTFVAGDELVTRYQTPGARIFNLYPGLERSFPIALTARSRLDGADGRPTGLITVARLSREKGIDDLLRALALLRERGCSARAVVAGDGPDRLQLEELARSLGIADWVLFRGFTPHGPELVRLLDEADVFVLPSRSEGLPHSVVEAMARGLPVIATKVGGMARLLGDGTGILVSQENPSELAEAIARVAEDADLRAELSTGSIRKVQAFVPERQLDEFCSRLAESYPQFDWRSSDPHE